MTYRNAFATSLSSRTSRLLISYVWIESRTAQRFISIVSLRNDKSLDHDTKTIGCGSSHYPLEIKFRELAAPGSAPFRNIISVTTNLFTSMQQPVTTFLSVNGMAAAINCKARRCRVPDARRLFSTALLAICVGTGKG